MPPGFGTELLLELTELATDEELELGATELGAELELGAAELGATELGAAELGATELGAELEVIDEGTDEDAAPQLPARLQCA